MKKFLKVILIILLIVGILPVFPTYVSAAENGTLSDTVSWELNDNGVLTISGIGATPNYKNSSFGSSKSPFYGSTDIKEVIISEGITVIGDYLFKNCTNITCITIPEGLTSINTGAFDKCTGVTKIYWNSNSFEDFTSSPDIFSNMGSSNQELEVVFGNNVTKIPDYICSKNSSNTLSNNYITSVIIPDSVTSIGEYAFFGCSKLSSITIPNSVTTIGVGAFMNCSSLKTIVIPDSIKVLNEGVFAMSGIEVITIPDTIESIALEAFLMCYVDCIFFGGDETTWNALTEHIRNSTLLPSSNFGISKAVVHYNATYHVFTSFSVRWEPTCYSTGEQVGYCEYCDYSETLVMDIIDHDYVVYTQEPTCQENGYTHYECQYCNHNYTEEITKLPHNFVEDYCDMCGESLLDYYEFDDGVVITECYGNEIPETINGKPVIEIANDAFAGNQDITSIVIPDSVEYIGFCAFAGCTNLKSVEFGKNIECIQEDAFAGCTSLEYVIFSETDIDDISKYLYFYDSTVTSSSKYNYVGTGDVITVINDYYVMEFTCVVRNDINGDSVCNVLDVFDVERASNGNAELDGAYALAGDSNSDDVIDITDYQSIVNQALAS